MKRNFFLGVCFSCLEMDSSCSIPHSVQIQWYEIRDLLLRHQFAAAFEKASVCEHPDALWLRKVFAGKDSALLHDSKFVREVLLDRGEDDERALLFARLLRPHPPFGSGPAHAEDWEAPVRRSAQLGYAFAQAWLAEQMDGEERFKLAQLAAAQGERSGLFVLGCCFLTGDGCKKDADEAKHFLLAAAELGHSGSCRILTNGLLDSSSDRRFWRYWEVAVASGVINMNNFDLAAKHVKSFDNTAVVFAIGRTMKSRLVQDHVSFRTRRLVDRAICFYEGQLEACRRAIDSWTIIGIRFQVPKDVRLLIGRLVWKEREEANYQILNEERKSACTMQ